MRSVQELAEQFRSGKYPAGSRVVVRADLNVPLADGEVRDDLRIRAAVPTLQLLLDAGAAIVLCSHLGRPKGVDPQFSLAPVAKTLHVLLDRPVGLLAAPPGPELESAVANLDRGSIALLENLRFYPGEKGNDPALAKALASLGVAYVNDAFGTCHRAHASVVGIPAHLPAFAGKLVEKEVATLSRLRDDPPRPFWIVSGGSKVSDKIAIVENLAGKVDGFAVGGGMANTFLAGLGEPVGASFVEEEWLERLRKVIDDATATGVEWAFPSDFVAGDRLESPSETRVVRRGEDPGALGFYDIGPETRAEFVRQLSSARAIFWNGPVGVFEESAYAEGTREIANALAGMESERVIGGGDTAAAVRHFGVADRMTHVSTGGGASLTFLEGEPLPGVDALNASPE